MGVDKPLPSINSTNAAGEQNDRREKKIRGQSLGWSDGLSRWTYIPTWPLVCGSGIYCSSSKGTSKSSWSSREGSCWKGGYPLFPGDHTPSHGGNQGPGLSHAWHFFNSIVHYLGSDYCGSRRYVLRGWRFLRAAQPLQHPAEHPH